MQRRYFEEMTLGQVGQELGYSRERIRQIQHKATRKIRNLLSLSDEEVLLAAI